MAIERGDLVFDNQAHLSHRAMAAILGVILKLPRRDRRSPAASSACAYIRERLLREDQRTSAPS